MTPLPPPDPMVTGVVNPRFAHLPRELGSFASRLPAVNLPSVAPSAVDAVMDTLINSDVTAEGVRRSWMLSTRVSAAAGAGRSARLPTRVLARKHRRGALPSLRLRSDRPPWTYSGMRQAVRPRTDQAEFS